MVTVLVSGAHRYDTYISTEPEGTTGVTEPTVSYQLIGKNLHKKEELSGKCSEVRNAPRDHWGLPGLAGQRNSFLTPGIFLCQNQTT